MPAFQNNDPGRAMLITILRLILQQTRPRGTLRRGQAECYWALSEDLEVRVTCPNSDESPHLYLTCGTPGNPTSGGERRYRHREMLSDTDGTSQRDSVHETLAELQRTIANDVQRYLDGSYRDPSFPPWATVAHRKEDMDSLHIMVVDDHELVREALEMILQAAGYRLSFFSEAETALRQFEAVHPDLVITDYGLPQMNGLELAAEFKSVSPEIPIILLTSRDPGDFPDLSAVDRYVEKGGATKKLLRTIEELASGKGAPA